MLRRLIACAGLVAGARTTHAQPPVRETVTLVAGAAAGLLVHESGHVLASWAFNASPGIKSIRYAGVPFFAVTHHHVPRRTEFVISSAGFWTQHAGSEWLLTRYPTLRREGPAFARGMLLFNLATSLLYTGGAVGRLGPPEGDALGMSNVAGSQRVARASRRRLHPRADAVRRGALLRAGASLGDLGRAR